MAEVNLSGGRVSLTGRNLREDSPVDERKGYETQSIDSDYEKADKAWVIHRDAFHATESSENVAARHWAYIADRARRC